MKVPTTFITLLLTGVASLAVATEDNEIRAHQLNGGPLTRLLAESNAQQLSTSTSLRSSRVKGQSDSARRLQGPPPPYGPPPPPGYYYAKGSKGSKGGGSGTCDSVTVYYETNKFKQSFLPIGKNYGGANNNVPVYDAQTGKKLALYTEVSTAYGPVDCYVNGAWTFDVNDNGKAIAQLFSTSTCFANADAITGGIGTFTCAKGVVRRLNNRGSGAKQFFEISVCAGSC